MTKEKLSETIQKARSLINMIRSSQALTNFVLIERRTLKILNGLINDCITRWNSTYMSMKSLRDNKLPVSNLLENKRKLSISSSQKEKLTLLELSTDDWLVIDYLLSIFEPFYQATHLISGSKYSTIGLCLFALRNMKEYLEEDDENQPTILCDLKRLVLESLNHYFDEKDEQNFLLMVSSSWNTERDECFD